MTKTGDLLSRTKTLICCVASHLVDNLAGHGDDFGAPFPQHDEPLQAVHQAGQPKIEIMLNRFL